MQQVCFVLLVMSVAAAAASAQPVPEAIFSALDLPDFAVADRAMSRMSAPAKGVADRQPVGMRLDRLFDSGAARVLLNVDGHAWIADVERLDRVGAHRAWVGSIEGIPYSHVSFTERDGIVSGLINALSESYAVQTVAPGVYTLGRVVDTGGELEPLLSTRAADAKSSTPVPDARRVWVGLDAPVAHDDARFIDVLLLYTTSARVARGVPQLNADIARIISDSNTIFSRSGIATRFRLAPSPSSLELAGFGETTDFSADLDRFSQTTLVHDLRDSTGADLVQLLVNKPDAPTCGIGFLLTRQSESNPSAFDAYSIADVACIDIYTPTHEMSHNMGSYHAPDDGGSGGLFPYSYGYKDPAGGFRTVMAYTCATTSCPRIPNFSNPRVVSEARGLRSQVSGSSVTLTWNGGGVTGTPLQDNAASINTVASYVANFRPSTFLPAPALDAARDVTWRPSAATSYTLQIGSAAGAYNLLTLSLGNTTTISAADVPLGNYYWRILTSDPAGAALPSIEAQFSVTGCTPGAPQNFAFVVGANRMVTLAWAAPLSGSGPFNYTVEAGSQTGLANILVAPVGEVTSITVQAPPETYFVRIRATNGCAPAGGAASAERMIVVP